MAAFVVGVHHLSVGSNPDQRRFLIHPYHQAHEGYLHDMAPLHLLMKGEAILTMQTAVFVRKKLEVL